MLADAIAPPAVGSVCGTSTVTTFVESSAGVAEGGRTGLASMATAALFFIAMFLAPVAQLIPTYACAAALIYVGVLMMSNVRSIDWDDPASAVPGFMTVAFMPLTYNISYGIAFGLISYVFIKLFTGKIKEVNAGTWVITHPLRPHVLPDTVIKKADAFLIKKLHLDCAQVFCAPHKKLTLAR